MRLELLQLSTQLLLGRCQRRDRLGCYGHWLWRQRRRARRLHADRPSAGRGSAERRHGGRCGGGAATPATLLLRRRWKWLIPNRHWLGLLAARATGGAPDAAVAPVAALRNARQDCAAQAAGIHHRCSSSLDQPRPRYAQLGSLALARLELRLRALEVLPKLEDLQRLRALLLVKSSHARLGPLRATSDGDLPKGVRVQLCRGPHVLAWRVDTWRVERLRLEGEGGARHALY